jgi:hypothetical protein
MLSGTEMPIKISPSTVYKNISIGNTNNVILQIFSILYAASTCVFDAMYLPQIKFRKHVTIAVIVSKIKTVFLTAPLLPSVAIPSIPPKTAITNLIKSTCGYEFS